LGPRGGLIDLCIVRKLAVAEGLDEAHFAVNICGLELLVGRGGDLKAGCIAVGQIMVRGGYGREASHRVLSGVGGYFSVVQRERHGCINGTADEDETISMVALHRHASRRDSLGTGDIWLWRAVVGGGRWSVEFILGAVGTWI
jgi:hypothetical protein